MPLNGCEREMPIDYSTRQTTGNVSRNRPRKKSIGGIVLLSMTALSVSYLMGLATGWFLYGQQPRPVTIAKPTAQASSPTSPPTIPPPPDSSSASPAVTQPPPTMPLTFYDTLAKGEKGVMGSGINPAPVKRETTVQKPVPAPQTPPPTPVEQGKGRAESRQSAEQPKQRDDAQKKDGQEQVKVESDGTPKQKGESLKPVVPTPRAPKKYAVQIVSTADRGEAESVKSRYQAKGFPAYVVTFDHNGKSWYRVRAGRSMTEQAAKTLASSIGDGAIVVTE